MKNKNSTLKSHMIFGGIFALGLILLNSIPSIQAKSGDLFTLQKSNKDVFRIKENGGVETSSEGVANSEGLFIAQQAYVGVQPTSNTWLLNPEIKIPTGTLFSNGSLVRSGTTYMDVQTGSITLRQPDVPRTIRVHATNSSGSIVIKGTDTFNRVREETIFFPDGRRIDGQVPFAYVTSMTVILTTVTASASSTTINVGISTGIGFSYNFDFSTDVFKVVKDGIHVSPLATAGSDPTQDTVNIDSTSTNSDPHDYTFWTRIRKTIFTAPTPSDSVTTSNR